MNNRDLINSIFTELRKCFIKQQDKYKRLAIEETQDDHQETARTMLIVAQAYERALSKVIEIEVNMRIKLEAEEAENDRRP